jgi:hypothetical protein
VTVELCDLAPTILADGAALQTFDDDDVIAVLIHVYAGHANVRNIQEERNHIA